MSYINTYIIRITMYNACITISSLVPDLQVSGSSVGEGDTHREYAYTYGGGINTAEYIAVIRL